MFIFDRLYGHLNFPPLIQKVLDCPGLLRLRGVGMANVPFFSFPSFSSVTRYEHSLGVCHLANILSKSINLSEKDRLELMLAALYHDVATPPFAHAMEEVLNESFGFDHETKLRDLIIGKHDLSAGQKKQIYLGHSLKIHRICQSKEGRKLGIDALRIADLATGNDTDFLGDLICSSGLDLDNVDNVVRAATAMGIKETELSLPEIIASSFIFGKGKLHLDEGSNIYIQKWKKARSRLYGMIFSSVKDFSLQTMLKEAVRILPKNVFDENDWALTDNQLLFDKLLHYRPSSEIVNRMLLGKTFNCLAHIIIEGVDVIQKRENYSEIIKRNSEEIYIKYLSKKFKNDSSINFSPNISVNYYIDKRDRDINRSFIFFSRLSKNKNVNVSPCLIFGVFTSNNQIWDKDSVELLLEAISNWDSETKTFKAKISFENYPDIKKDEQIQDDSIN